MPLEATLFCLDNSGYSRNADYNITRLAAQLETLQFLGSAKIRDNMESLLGVLSMAGPRVQVHVSLSREMVQLMNSVRPLRSAGYCDIINSLKVAHLTLKNRQNKSQRQRIVIFIASPILCSSTELVTMGKQLKKNNVHVDVIHFGTENLVDPECKDTESNCTKVRDFMAAVNNNDESRLIVIPTTTNRLSDDVLLSPIGKDVRARVTTTAPPSYASISSAPVAAPAASTSTSSSGTAMNDNVDPAYAAALAEIDSLMEIDPELAMAMRLSLDEYFPTGGSTSSAAATATTASTSTPATTAPVTAEVPVATDMMDDYDEDAELAAAIALSMMIDQPGDDEEEQQDQATENTEDKNKNQDNENAKDKEQKDKDDKKKKDGQDEDEDADDFMNSLLSSNDRKSDQ